MGLDERDRINIVSKIDVFVAIFILIIGILVIIVGAGYLDTVIKQDEQNRAMAEQYSESPFFSSYSYTPTPLWTWATPWFIIVLGITTLIYGIKRTLDDIFKVKINSRQRNLRPPVQYQPPVQHQPPQRPPNQY